MKELLKQWKKIEFGTCLWLLRSLRVIDLVFTFGQTSIIKSMPINKIQQGLSSVAREKLPSRVIWYDSYRITYMKRWEVGNCYVGKCLVRMM